MAGTSPAMTDDNSQLIIMRLIEPYKSGTMFGAASMLNAAANSARV
ncbi:hypothetical protein HNQ36_002495 [Afipia massiliensis]|uniref:Uncharacterized protein n=1 Tax=Afipia massiliensis TaxID=211460 RepID=A0A840N3W1_9BRAD|nr:hypothetical protein [Afipia massiliensis]